MSLEIDLNMQQEENAPLNIISILSKKDAIYNQLRLPLAQFLLQSVDMNYLETSGITYQQTDYLLKSLVTSLSTNESLEIRRILTQIIKNILSPTLTSPPTSELSHDKKREIIKMILQYLVLEMQTSDEKKSLYILESLDSIFLEGTQIVNTTNKSINVIKLIQQFDFLLEYILNTLLFLLQNRKKPQVVLYTVRIQASIIQQAGFRASISCFISNLLEIILFVIQKSSDEVKIECIKCLLVIFQKEPYLVIKSYENEIDFTEIVDSIKGSNPELVLIGLEFWNKFIMLEGVSFSEEFKAKLFEKVLPFIMDQCKVKGEDFDKFKRDKDQAELVEKSKEINRMTIRTKAVKSLQIFSNRFQREVFGSLRPTLQKFLQSTKWEEREAAVIVLGVIIGDQKDIKSLEQQLQYIVPFLVEELTSKNSQIRASACWTLSQPNFSDWIMNCDESLIFSYFNRMLNLAIDQDKSVQKSALSNLSLLLQHEKSKYIFHKKLNHLCECLQQSFQMVDRYTLMSLSDVIYNTVLIFQEKSEDFCIQLMPYLIKEFSILDEDQVNSIFSIIDCFSVISSLLREKFENYGKQIIQKSIIISQQFFQGKNFKFKDNELEKEIIQKILELVSAIFKNCNFNQNSLKVIFDDIKMFDLLLLCFNSSYLNIVQDSLAIYIELLNKIPIQVHENYANEIVMILKDKLKWAKLCFDIDKAEDFNKIQVCNNSCWAIGELTKTIPNQIKVHLKEIVHSLADMLNTDILTILHKKNEQMLIHFSKSISLTLGRLALLDPQLCSSCLGQIIKPWCLSLRYVSGSEEKTQAFIGLCKMIPHNPLGIVNSFSYFCEALLEFKDPPPELEKLFYNLILTFRQCLQEQEWNAFISSFPPHLREQFNIKVGNLVQQNVSQSQNNKDINN